MNNKDCEILGQEDKYDEEYLKKYSVKGCFYGIIVGCKLDSTNVYHRDDIDTENNKIIRKNKSK